MMILPRKFVDIEMPGAVGMKGEYRLRVIRDDGTVKQDTGWFDNIILDAGLNRWGTGTIISGAAIGTGTSTPTAAQTQLDTQTAFTTTAGTGNGTQTAQATSPYYIALTSVYRTAVGALNGNYTEVGVGWGSNLLFSRALILNNVGTPTSISVTSTEQLDISYRLRLYPPTADVTSSPVIGGVTYSLTGRAMNVTTGSNVNGWFVGAGAAIGLDSFPATSSVFYAGAIGAITASPSGTAAVLGASPSIAAYSNNSMQLVKTMLAGLTNGNLAGGIRSVSSGWSIAQFQYEFSPLIPKDSTKTLALTFSINWARKP